MLRIETGYIKGDLLEVTTLLYHQSFWIKILAESGLHPPTIILDFWKHYKMFSSSLDCQVSRQFCCLKYSRTLLCKNSSEKIRISTHYDVWEGWLFGSLSSTIYEAMPKTAANLQQFSHTCALSLFTRYLDNDSMLSMTFCYIWHRKWYAEAPYVSNWRFSRQR